MESTSAPADIKKAIQPIKVLVADDDTPTRILLRAAIAQWGFQVIEAKDGEEAWQIMQGEDAPRILIVDWMMPKMDGITLCQRCRETNTEHPFIILLTQMTGSTNTIKGLEAGADEFLPKPFNMAELRSRLAIGRRLIENAQTLAKYKNQLEQIKTTFNQLSQTLMTVAGQLKESQAITNNPELKKLFALLTNLVNSHDE